MDEKDSLSLICPNPACDKDIVVEFGKIKRAVGRKGMFGGLAVVGCPICCNCFVLPDELPTDGSLLKQFIVEQNEESDDWCECVPMLPETQIVANMPVGHIDIHGSTFYKPGTGKTAIDKYTYMRLYAIDPECAEYKSGRPIKKVGT